MAFHYCQADWQESFEYCAWQTSLPTAKGHDSILPASTNHAIYCTHCGDSRDTLSAVGEPWACQWRTCCQGLCISCESTADSELSCAVWYHMSQVPNIPGPDILLHLLFSTTVWCGVLLLVLRGTVAVATLGLCAGHLLPGALQKLSQVTLHAFMNASAT